MAGIDQDTLINWKKRYSDFSDRIEQKKLELEARLLDRIKKAGEKTWQADAWLLERLRPEKYSERRRIELDAEPFLKIIEAPEEEVRKVMEGQIVSPKELSEPEKSGENEQ